MSDETIFVAVGKNVERCKPTLFWALDNFAGKKICLIHVHKPALLAAFNGKFVSFKPKENKVKVSQQDVDIQKMFKALNQYESILAEARVEANKIWIEMDDVGKGILEIITSRNIRWLVMGAAANNYFSKNLSTLKSKKAIFVCQNAPGYLQIWFTCKGCLIYTRELRSFDMPKEEINEDKDLEEEYVYDPSLLSRISLHGETRQLARSMSEPVPETSDQSYHAARRSRSDDFTYSNRSFGSLVLTPSIVCEPVTLGSPKIGDSGFQEQPREMKSQGSEDLTGTFEFRSLANEEERTQGSEVEDIHYRLELALVDVKKTRKKEFEEALKRWKEEDNARDAKQNAITLEITYTKELNEKKELENELKRKVMELDAVKNHHSQIVNQLHSVREQMSALENQISESSSAEGELEEKILSAVDLLIAFKERRDKLRIEHEDAVQEVRKLRKSVKMETSSLCGPLIMSFTFEEIIEATNSFDQSCKIGDGAYGTMYRGTLRHVDVAIKMLRISGSRGSLDLIDEVEFFSRVRHPNLVTLIGICPESHSLIYEYLRNGNLKDRLTCRDKKSPPLPWQPRMLIAAEICSTLIFLHSHEPPIIHGNLKPSNILLDSNLISKISDLGISHWASTEEHRPGLNSSVYKDPEYFASGAVTQESDVYSLGVILLLLITGRSTSGIAKDVRCALEMGNFDTVLDVSAGDWPLDEVEQLARVATRCCESKKLDRPDLVSEIWTVLELMRDLAVNSASKLNVEESRQAPSHFVCPIYQEVMKDPLIAADGHTYEAEAIRGWLESGHNTSPMTNLKLEHTNLVPNYALLYAIQEWRQLL